MPACPLRDLSLCHLLLAVHAFVHHAAIDMTTNPSTALLLCLCLRVCTAAAPYYWYRMYGFCSTSGNPITFPDVGECNVNGSFKKGGAGSGGFDNSVEGLDRHRRLLL
jgi:hypothetical protein